MKTTVTKRFEFCYGHFLPGYNGKCKNVHGHNAVLEVTVSREEELRDGDYDGMVMDFSQLKRIMEPIIEQFDHQMLNGEEWESRIGNPTCENIAFYLFQRINDRLPDYYFVEKIRLTETPDSWAEVIR